MRRSELTPRFSIATAILTLMMAGGFSRANAGEIVDGIVATVNGQIILQSDWQDAIRYEAFMNGRSPGQVDAAERKSALDHLIDQELLREQIRKIDSMQPTEQQINSQIGEIRRQYQGADNDRKWKALLDSNGLTKSELRRRVTLQLQLSRLVDARLRPEASVSEKSIESYYTHDLLPQLRRSGAREVPLAQVSPKIKELLTQQKINQLLVAWLQDLHAGSEIRSQLFVSGAESQTHE